MSIKDMWGRLPEKVRLELVSMSHTLSAAIVTELGVQLMMHKELWDPTMLSKGLLAAVGLSVVRAAWKAAIQFIVANFITKK